MKTTYGWSANGNGTNSSGFAGLPGGNRNYGGAFTMPVAEGAGGVPRPLMILSHGSDCCKAATGVSAVPTANYWAAFLFGAFGISSERNKAFG